MASSLNPSAEMIAAPGSARPKPQVRGQGRLDALVRLLRLPFEVWSEARALQAKAIRRYPSMTW